MAAAVRNTLQKSYPKRIEGLHASVKPFIHVLFYILQKGYLRIVIPIVDWIEQERTSLNGNNKYDLQYLFNILHFVIQRRWDNGEIVESLSQ